MSVFVVEPHHLSASRLRNHGVWRCWSSLSLAQSTRIARSDHAKSTRHSIIATAVWPLHWPRHDWRAYYSNRFRSVFPCWDLNSAPVRPRNLKCKSSVWPTVYLHSTKKRGLTFEWLAIVPFTFAKVQGIQRINDPNQLLIRHPFPSVVRAALCRGGQLQTQGKMMWQMRLTSGISAQWNFRLRRERVKEYR